MTCFPSFYSEKNVCRFKTKIWEFVEAHCSPIILKGSSRRNPCGHVLLFCNACSGDHYKARGGGANSRTSPWTTLFPIKAMNKTLSNKLKLNSNLEKREKLRKSSIHLMKCGRNIRSFTFIPNFKILWM